MTGDGKLQEQVVTSARDLTDVCGHIAACSRIGLDTEFVGEDTYHPHLCLVQVATSDRLILIDPLTTGSLDEFWSLVTDPAREVVVHAGREEVRLCRLCTGRAPGQLCDLQIAAGLVGLAYPLGHAGLVSQLLDVQLVKGETLTEWRDRPLTRAQIQYAYDDVRYLLPLWSKLRAELESLQRLDWAREEFDRLAASVTEEPAVERWRKLRGIGGLDRRRLAIVRDLHSWREDTAVKTNRPARVICRDDLLVEVARRNPVRERDLAIIRGLSRRHVPAILQVVQRARQLPIEQCPETAGREQDSPQILMVANVLQALLGHLCITRRLAANLVASSNDVKALVRSYPDFGSAQVALTRGWRARHILPELVAMLEGRVSLRVADPRAEAPFSLARTEDHTHANDHRG
jgi:ribonuclease D